MVMGKNCPSLVISLGYVGNCFASLGVSRVKQGYAAKSYAAQILDVTIDAIQ